MRQFIWLSILCIAIAACGVNNRRGDKYIIPLNKDSINTQKIDTVMNEYKLTRGFERFDEARYNQRKDKEYDLEILLSDGTFIRMTEWADGKGYIATPDKSYFELTKIYYSNGNIRTKGLSYVYAFPIGIWYEFNEQGEFVREVDYDAPFKFTFEKVLEFCKKEGITVEKGYIPQSTGFHTTIYRETSDVECWWEIEHLKNIGKAAYAEQIRLDGKTGKVISRREYEFTNN